MPMNPTNQRVFHRHLYAGWLETITLLKRNNDQQAGVVRALTLYECRHSIFSKSGEPIQGDMSSNQSTIWHIPRTELDRVGVAYINAADRIIDQDGNYWQPESTTNILVKLSKVHVCIFCLSINPPGVNA